MFSILRSDNGGCGLCLNLSSQYTEGEKKATEGHEGGTKTKLKANLSSITELVVIMQRLHARPHL